MAYNCLQLFNGSVVLTDDRDTYKLFQENFDEIFKKNDLIESLACRKIKNGMYLYDVKYKVLPYEISVLYQDMRSGDHEGDDRKRFQLSEVELLPDRQYFYVGGYDAGDKKIILAVLKGTRAFNQGANNSSLWFNFDEIKKVYDNSINIWNPNCTKTNLTILACTDAKIDFLHDALITSTLDCEDDVMPKTETLNVFPFPLQTIYFGAPGTGKSHEIKSVVKKNKSYRITFHPDTDYSSFVGTYKPISVKVPLRDALGKVIRDAAGNVINESKIHYSYVKQAFLNAYVDAWKEQENEIPQPVFLVIEEINRGNCAQIFGDVFQLLDRNENGFSEYAIVPDTDLSSSVKEELEKLNIANKEEINDIYEDCETDMVGKVLNCERLLLPNNMYILATMNTSDQSLFPIDSAFKRRWDWKYIKITNANKDWKIDVNGKHYDWWRFLKSINYFIFDATQSEDKNLGYFFVKAKNDIVSAESFVSKVIFYLYTDVFKDYGFGGDIFKGENDDEMSFQSFYNNDGSPNETQIARFIENVIYSESLPEEMLLDVDIDLE